MSALFGRTMLVLAVVTLPAPTAAGQDPDETRTGSLIAERRARLAEVEPASDSRIVRMLTTIENDDFDQIVSVQAGDFRFGFGKISPASGGTPAIQYARPRLGSTPLTLRTAAAYSFRGFQAVEAQLGVFDIPVPYPFAGDGFLGAPFDFDNRSVAPLDELIYLDALYRRFPKEEFYGLGPDSSNADRSRYGIDEVALDLVVGYQPARWLAMKANGGLLVTETGPSDSDRFPDTGDLFTPKEAPGLGDRTEFLRVGAGIYAVWAGDPNLPALELGWKGPGSTTRTAAATRSTACRRMCAGSSRWGRGNASSPRGCLHRATSPTRGRRCRST